ncbi:MAG TPA: flagellar assembly protein FliH [Burkholderiaceae bacterium]|nr:flagellar assembly protein FliH [Burkholderiaceae bacterium]
MGAPDQKGFRGFIPKEQIGEASSWEFASLTGEGGARVAPSQLTERELRAFERGRTQGHGEGQAAERRVKAEQGAKVAQLIDQMGVRFAELQEHGAGQLLELAFTIARQVVRREISLQRDALLPVAREAVAMIIDQHAHPRVFLNPQDFATLRADFDADGLFKGCRFIADARIARGGCRVETAQGEIDATVTTRWERVLAALGSSDATGEIEVPMPGAADDPRI